MLKATAKWAIITLPVENGTSCLLGQGFAYGHINKATHDLQPDRPSQYRYDH